MSCFFKKVKPSDPQIIKGFDDLRWDDQETIRKKINGTSTKESSTYNKKNKKIHESGKTIFYR